MGLDDDVVIQDIRICKHEFVELGNAIDDVAKARCGRKSQIDHLDGLYLLLMRYAHNFSLKTLADVVHARKEQLISIFDWISKALHQFLISKFSPMKFQFDPRMCPNTFGWCSIIIDSTTIPAHNPSGTFGESMVLFDGKNRMYGFKYEVGILNTDKPVAVMISSHFPGSVHDLTLHRSFETIYKNDMRVNENQRSFLPLEMRNQEFFGFLADMGYISSENLIKVYTPFKGNTLTPNQSRFNALLVPVRVQIENFFGRSKTCFKFLTTAHKNDGLNYEIHVPNCFLLTNFLVVRVALNERDRESYRNILDEHLRMIIERKRKRNEQRRNWNRRRRSNMNINGERRVRFRNAMGRFESRIENDFENFDLDG